MYVVQFEVSELLKKKHSKNNQDFHPKVEEKHKIIVFLPEILEILNFKT